MRKGIVRTMITTLTVDASGRLILPAAAIEILGMKPGESIEVDVERNRIRLQKETPLAKLIETEDGMLVLAPSGVPVDVAAAIRAEREDQAERALPGDCELAR